jgi:hypothetical protein
VWIRSYEAQNLHCQFQRTCLLALLVCLLQKPRTLVLLFLASLATREEPAKITNLGIAPSFDCVFQRTDREAWTVFSDSMRVSTPPLALCVRGVRNHRPVGRFFQLAAGPTRTVTPPIRGPALLARAYYASGRE